MAVPEPVTPAHSRPVVVTLPDEIDLANADGVGRQIAAEFTRGVGVVVADMTATRFCDTCGTRALVQACHRAADDGCELRLLRPSARVMYVWKILGLDAVLPVYHSLDEAMLGG